jgi:hypothetical protein
VFHDLDASLEALMKAELPVKGAEITFASPDGEFADSGYTAPAISFFLYDIRENADLRSNMWEVDQSPDGTMARRRPPARIDCSYLITAWPGKVDDRAKDEHMLLGEVLKVLLRHHTIPAQYLRESLVGQQPPVATKIIAENQLQSLGEFWQAMGGRPKATLHYGITLSVDVFDPVDAGPRVREHMIRIGRGDAFLEHGPHRPGIG